MFNVKWGLFPAGAAFLLAFISSLLLGQVGLGLALLRAVIFAVLFFGIGCGAWVLISTYVPELLFFEGNKETGDGVFHAEMPATASPGSPTGSNINITLGDAEDSSLPAALPGDSYGIDGIGNIADLVSKAIDPMEKVGDIDQASANNYTSELGDFDFASTMDDPIKPETAEIAGLGDFSSFFDGLTANDATGDADDSFTDFFQTLSNSSRPAGSEEIPKMERRTTETKATAEIKGDFSPKEIAAGLRTVLAKEKRG
ncbi:MAG: hypothetical protein FWB78_05125 [Treponema sp.]|nr:hypothetical protein [Treponema sp.]